MNNKYSRKTPLIAFLIDLYDKSNNYGKIMCHVFQLFGVQQNQFIDAIEAKKNMIPNLKDVQLFSKS